MKLISVAKWSGLVHNKQFPAPYQERKKKKNGLSLWECLPPPRKPKLEKDIAIAHRGARTHDHKVKSLALYQLS